MWPNPQFPADLVTFTEEILTGKLFVQCNHIKSNIERSFIIEPTPNLSWMKKTTEEKEITADICDKLWTKIKRTHLIDLSQTINASSKAE